MAISQNEKNVAKELSTDCGTSGHAYEHTTNLGKYTIPKGFIFKMASKMVAGQAKNGYISQKEIIRMIFYLILVPANMLMNILTI